MQNTQLYEVPAAGRVHTITNAPRWDALPSVSCLKRISILTAFLTATKCEY
jgi:hypothetical protein